MRDSQNDLKITNEQKAKIEEKFYNMEKEQASSLESYKQILQEIELYKNQHVERMNQVFEKTQEFEKKRLIFYKTVFLDCHRLMQTYNDERFEKIFEEYFYKVNAMNPTDNLKWWTEYFGVDKPIWPEFEEYAK